MSLYIISAYGDLSLSQALDEFNNDPLHWHQQTKVAMVRGLLRDHSLHCKAYSHKKAVNWASAREAHDLHDAPSPEIKGTSILF
ncbi:hypothetical protein ZEAMMB73_Zm00001d034847 [Zea mays]|uniref:Uncharacterized protein n=1 Tax=Zea mays TaxID=4577 RepID=A0A1D6LBX5_MAIZE|nr:hypothetical protein ZEAMMB73_Zm00001d034847 [Zea mays]